jgi:hypothetical protein
VDVPPRLVDDLAVYKVMYPPIGEGFVFRQEKGQPMDPDTWHRERLVPILKRANLYRPGTGLHSIRHTYVILLIAQGGDVGHIADQVGHSTTRLTQDLYRHVFRGARVEAMRRLNGAIPVRAQAARSAGAPPAEESGRQSGAEGRGARFYASRHRWPDDRPSTDTYSSDAARERDRGNGGNTDSR